jgi:hypothetical protein
MSGIFLFFDPEGISPSMEKKFNDRLLDRVSRMPEQCVDTLRKPTFIGAASHHGVLPTGGVASNEQGHLVATGSCWIEADAEKLAAPAEILEAFNAGTKGDRPRLHGTFALAHCDHNRAELTVESDFWAVYPMYFRQMGSAIAVSSALKFLVEPGEETVNQDAVAEMLAMGFVPRTHTLIEGIHRLPANSRLVFGRGGLSVSHFPGPVYSRQRPFDENAIDEYDHLIRRYLRRFRNLAPSYCISMSGGLDSRLLGAAALREDYSISAFTIGESGSLDARMAGKVCDLMDIPLTTHDVDGSTLPSWFGKTVWFTEGRALPGHLHYMTAQLTKAVPKGPQLAGFYGEAAIGGHYDAENLMSVDKSKIMQGCRDQTKPTIYWPQNALNATLNKDYFKRTGGLKGLISDDLLSQMDFDGTYSDYLNFSFKLHMNSYMNPCLVSQLLPWSDVVCPFYDLPAFELGASLSLEDIANKSGQIKWMLRHLPDIGRIPRVKSGVVIDILDSDQGAYDRGMAKILRAEKIRYILCRLSQGRINLPNRLSFPEYGSWYRRWAPVRNYVDGILLSEQTLDRGIFQREGLRNLLNDLRIGRNTWGAVGTCLMLEIFLRQFVDGTDWPEDPVTPLGLEP